MPEFACTRTRKPHTVDLPELSADGETPTIVTAPGTWEFTCDGLTIKATAHRGFVYDGASVPLALRGIVSPKEIAPTALLHDLLYRQNNHRAAMIMQDGKPLTNWQWTKEDADELFCRFMKFSNAKTVNIIERRLAFRAVDIFGDSSYQTTEMREWAENIAERAADYEVLLDDKTTTYEFTAPVIE